MGGLGCVFVKISRFFKLACWEPWSQIDIHLALGYEISQVAIFKSEGGKNGHQSIRNFEIDIYRPCDISILKVWRPWLIYTKLIILEPLSWPIWLYLDQRVYKQCDISNSKVWRPWLMYTKVRVVELLSWSIWPYLENGHLLKPNSESVTGKPCDNF